MSSVGTPLVLDTATTGRTRPSMAKIRVKVDLLKPLPESVWIGQESDNSPLTGYAQKIKYEGIMKYCKECRKLGHNVQNCRVIEKKKASKVEEKSNTNGTPDANKVMNNIDFAVKEDEPKQDKYEDPQITIQRDEVSESRTPQKDYVAESNTQQNIRIISRSKNATEKGPKKKLKNKFKKLPKMKNIVILNQVYHKKGTGKIRSPSIIETNNNIQETKMTTTSKIVTTSD